MTEGKKDLEARGLMGVMQCAPQRGNKFGHKKKILRQLGGEIGSYAIFEREVITHDIWSSFSTSMQASFFVLLHGKRVNDIKAFAELAMTDRGRGRFPSAWYADGHFCWECLRRWSWTEADKRRFSPDLPFISLLGGRGPRVGVATLARLSGLDPETAKRAVERMEAEHRLIVYPPGKTGQSYRFVMPPAICRHCQPMGLGK